MVPVHVRHVVSADPFRLSNDPSKIALDASSPEGSFQDLGHVTTTAPVRVAYAAGPGGTQAPLESGVGGDALGGHPVRHHVGHEAGLVQISAVPNRGRGCGHQSLSKSLPSLFLGRQDNASEGEQRSAQHGRLLGG